MKRGVATFTLDYGKCPPWLFQRMVKLARIITVAVVERFGPDEFLERMSDPVWFQSFGSLLAFDWNASGLTTTTMGALKEALFGLETDLGIFVAGGKGKTSKKTPDQILAWGRRINLPEQKSRRYAYLSKLTAKVDSALIQDGFQLYHHNFLFTKQGGWAVIQQGMNTEVGRARRYHWYSKHLKDLTIEPHSAIQSEVTIPKVLNLSAKKSLPNREGTVELVKHKKSLFYEIRRIKKHGDQLTLLDLSNEDFSDHPVNHQRFDQSSLNRLKDSGVPEMFTKQLEDSVRNLVEKSVDNFEEVLMTPKVGPKTIRALTLVSEVVFGSKPSYDDPIRYTYAFGGKDGVPYPINKKTYDETIEIIEKALKKSSLGHDEKEKLLRRNEKLFTKSS
ncbi:hypothetical protein A3G67_05075 [Candidatus Roizmanbacteria bacterium RIFCSPLOWO2_12_FULL_40_12]|nr:MAG: hypothetical protein A3G67_05075 [Candidatus Roizmanbacteria bacterium RIFCSPLOWO2_12_FULL_40_12]